MYDDFVRCEWRMVEPWKYRSDAPMCDEPAFFIVERDRDSDLGLCGEHLKKYVFWYGHPKLRVNPEVPTMNHSTKAFKRRVYARRAVESARAFRD
ncbi:hypothetical protein [Nocardia gipuzkoensis]